MCERANITSRNQLHSWGHIQLNTGTAVRSDLLITSFNPFFTSGNNTAAAMQNQFAKSLL